MGRWEAVEWVGRHKPDNWDVRDVQSGRVFASGLLEEHARQIVRDHNAVPGLVEIEKEYRVNRMEMRSLSKGWPELQLGKYQKDIDRIDIVLAQAEGQV